jgi:hypothetical protein
MSCFHLHIRCDGEFFEDEEGIERANVEAAIIEAVRSVRSLVAGDVQRGELHLDQSIEISDDQGRHLTTINFAEAILTIPARQEDGSVQNV